MTDNTTTTQTGAPVASDDHSLTAGSDGATVLHDRYLVEKLAQFSRERIPERIVHAKGGGAFGEFVVTEDVSRYTRAAVFQPGARTRTLQRNSCDGGAGLAGYLARRPRVQREVLHERGQLRHRREQHSRLLHPRRHQVP